MPSGPSRVLLTPHSTQLFFTHTSTKLTSTTVSNPHPYSVITSTRFPLSSHISPNFCKCHMAYKALHTGQPPYLSELLQHYEPTQTLRSSSSFQLSVPRHNLEFGSRAFRISAPKIWNLLPAGIRNSPSLPTFHRHLKTHHFQSAYPNP